MNRVECEKCDRSFTQIAQHWGASDCGYPSLTEEQKDIFTGLLMGDGCIAKGRKTPHFTANMTNRPFLEWLDSEMGVLTTGVRKVRTAEEQFTLSKESGFSPNADVERYSSVYNLTTRSHPFFKELREWYGDNGKVWPSKVTMNPIIFKMLYVSDGRLKDDMRDNGKPTIGIKAVNEAENQKKIRKMFSPMDVFPRFSDNEIYFSVGDTEYLIEVIGSPPPGFEYKWPERIEE